MAYLLLFVTLTSLALVWKNRTTRHGHLQVSVTHHQPKGRRLFEIELQGFVRATPHQTWAVLTDYARLPEFVPDLQASRLLSHSDGEAIIEQRGRAGFLFVRQAIHVVVRVVEQPFSSIDVTLLSGNMKHYSSHWTLTPQAPHGGTRIDYQGTLEPDFYVPLLLGRALVQRNVQTMLAAVLAEIERKACLGP